MNGCHIKPEQFFNLIFGYYDRYAESVSAQTANGDASADSAVVPTGEVWVINSAMAYHNDTAARVVLLRAMAGVSPINLKGDRALAQYVFLLWQGSLTLKAGDKMRVIGEALATGKSIYGDFWGYKMKVA